MTLDLTAPQGRDELRRNASERLHLTVTCICRLIMSFNFTYIVSKISRLYLGQQTHIHKESATQKLYCPTTQGFLVDDDRVMSTVKSGTALRAGFFFTLQ